MEKFNRAERRRQTARLKHNRKWYYGGSDQKANPTLYNAGWHRVPHTGKSLGMAVTTPATCSCGVCGNPRRRSNWYKGEMRRTLQERRHFDICKENY